jgi:hypothetical protein
MAGVASVMRADTEVVADPEALKIAVDGKGVLSLECTEFIELVRV